MKKPILVLLVLLALTPFAQLLAQTPPVAGSPAHPAAASASDAAQFLATLAGGDSVPAPLFLTSCTSSSQCPTGQLCCNVCGNPPGVTGSCLACTTPIRGRCPLIS
jgi:hypothetical protein